MPVSIGKDTSHYGKCREILKKIEQHNTFRIMITVLGLLYNIWYVLILITIDFGILTAVFAVLYTLELLITFIFSTPENLKICIASAGLTIFGIISGWLDLSFGIVFLILLIQVFFDRKKLNWLKEQSGYPYFNEYHENKMQDSGEEYQPEFHTDTISGDAMPELSDTPPVKKFTGARTGQQMPELSERNDFYAD
ncbi:MAG: hypothetical protein IJ642_03820 [Oscillospiraceae bacterium]|nr:hypothetical protein [Oscillospiraceae bacterium]